MRQQPGSTIANGRTKSELTGSPWWHLRFSQYFDGAVKVGTTQWRPSLRAGDFYQRFNRPFDIVLSRHRTDADSH